jgi:hypothetical protein
MTLDQSPLARLVYESVPPFRGSPAVINAIVEIPKGRRSKFEVDKRTGLMKLDRYLYSSSHCPGDNGFIPRTLADDGDALDVLVMVNDPTFTGCLIEARPIGVFSICEINLATRAPVRSPMVGANTGMARVDGENGNGWRRTSLQAADFLRARQPVARFPIGNTHNKDGSPRPKQPHQSKIAA